MRRTARRLPREPIAAPRDLRAEEMCRLTYRRAVDGCPSYTEYFKDGDDVPTGLCPIHEGNLKQRAQRALHLQRYITPQHFDTIGRLQLVVVPAECAA